MHIIFRDHSLRYTMDVKADKTNLVLDWLLEFRFSSLSILAQRIESTPENSNRFFNRLINDGVIQKFKNVHTRNDTYVMLTRVGLSYLEALGRDISRATTRVQNLGRYAQIIHDVAVQQAAINRITKYNEIVWDRHITIPGIEEKPDLLLIRDQQKVALEYERWRKDSKRIYRTFEVHANNLMNHHYNGIIYSFDKEVDRQFYQKLFDSIEWPRFKKDKKSSKLRMLDTPFFPDKINNLRKCFVFLHEPID